MGPAPTRATGADLEPPSRDRREVLIGLGFAALAVFGVPAAGLFDVDRSVLAAKLRSSPLGDVFARIEARIDAGSIERIEGLAPAILPAAKAAGVEPELVAAIVYAESRGRSGQTSSAGALGLMQLIPAAARDAARRAGVEVPGDAAELTRALLHDDALNLRLGAAHLAWLLEHRGGWSDEAVLVSYNAGRARLFDWIERHGSFDAWAASETARAEAGEPTTGALAYARQVLAVRARFRERGHLAAPD